MQEEVTMLILIDMQRHQNKFPDVMCNNGQMSRNISCWVKAKSSLRTQKMVAKHADGIGYRIIPKLLNVQVSHNPVFFFLTLNGHDQGLTTQDSIC